MTNRERMSFTLTLGLSMTAVTSTVGIVLLAALERQIPPTLTAVSVAAVAAMGGALSVPPLIRNNGNGKEQKPTPNP